MPVAVGDVVLEIPKAMPVVSRLGPVLVLKRFFQPVSVIAPVSARGPVSHDDVRVTVRRFTGSTVRVLDDLHQAVGVRILA
jgi:hypothetical protein